MANGLLEFETKNFVVAFWRKHLKVSLSMFSQKMPRTVTEAYVYAKRATDGLPILISIGRAVLNPNDKEDQSFGLPILISIGRAVLNPNDKEDQSFAMKLAFERAIKDLSKRNRKEVWHGLMQSMGWGRLTKKKQKDKKKKRTVVELPLKMEQCKATIHSLKAPDCELITILIEKRPKYHGK